ncbi:UV damage repair protein UvrX [Sporosarcina sp. P12(2017)]|uniref:Y-family DNA polymerase n=1 Tax=unclassified Sporosarcina TaxID=2647733 RepID=UPI000C162B16|nr:MULTISPECIES: UV damage repair protein UvrX [unclassified Sporosarcina]PIC57004.1 UV damage repair protein UvrX [Sporosarcina sp. P10]PIC60387.1 UV damage repair protein UvrX [Sporosarcina sp. P12(2017)]
MIDYDKFPNRNIACIDMMSFYASCMATLHKLDVQKVPIAVVGNLERKGSVVLAASPPMKKRFRVKTGTRMYEIPHHPDIKLFDPKMSYFLEMSVAVTRILHKYVPVEAIHVYSIDESFIDLTGTGKLWGDPVQTVKDIQKEILETLKLPSTAGMGPNMLMAKLALDLEAKKTGFSKWTFGDVPTKLWSVSPLSEMWGIGRQTEKSLNNMGIFSVGDLAHANLQNLEKKFGVLGNQLYHHAWGIDLSEMGAPILEGQVSYGKSQILLRDYNSREEVNTVLLEMCEDVARRARENYQAGRTISLGIGYSKNAFGGGFQRSRTIDEATNDTMKIYKVCMALLNENYDHRAVRQISVSITKLEDEHSMQLSLFDAKKWQVRKLGTTMDEIRTRFGSTAILRAVSLTDAGTAIKRSKLVGGHKG